MNAKNEVLKKIACDLEIFEDRIIFDVINRAQFKKNKKAYEKGKSEFPNSSKSLFEIRLEMEDELESKFNRFSIPEERPLSDIDILQFPPKRNDKIKNRLDIDILDYEKLNLSKDIVSNYIIFLDDICKNGDDKNYGSTVELDLKLLRSISTRIHFASFYIADAKYKNEKKDYDKLVKAGNKNGVLLKLTRKDKEQNIIKRVKQRVETFQKNISTSRVLIDSEKIAKLFEKIIIPLSKKGEVLYIFNVAIQ